MAKIHPFPTRARKTPPAGRGGGTGTGSEEEIQFVMLAVAYYVHTGRQREARRLVNFVSAHDPIPSDLRLPADLARLVEESDTGVAMFPD
jgi:hypothetical protein